MKFNIVYGNNAHEGVHISDTLRLIKYALESVGHTASLSKNMISGEINILMENFTYDFIEVMKQLKKKIKYTFYHFSYRIYFR